MTSPIHSTVATLPPLPSPSLQGKKIILASNSPRRRELLGIIVPAFEIAPARSIDESYPADMPAAEVPVFLSALKTKAYSDLVDENTVLVTADTVVICQGRIMGKPHDARQATDMLRSLSGRTHTVVTGVTVSSASGTISFAEHTSVRFAALDDCMIADYVERYRPFDKAGAYGIQEWIGAVGISGIDGCFYNVMGLPLHALYENLRKL